MSKVMRCAGWLAAGWLLGGGILRVSICRGEATSLEPTAASESRTATGDAATAVDLPLLWRFLGTSPEQWGGLSPEELRAVELRLLHELPRVPWNAWHPVDVWAATPQRVAGGVYRVEGELRQLVRRDVGQAAGLAFSEYYEGEVACANGQSLPFAVREIPQAWKSRLPATQEMRVWLAGINLAAPADGSGTSPKIIAERLVPWPQQPDLDSGFTHDGVWLAERGFDLGTWDAVSDRTSLQGRDRLAFYGLLAVAQENGADLATGSEREWDLTEVLPDPSSVRGGRGRLVGLLRRAVRVVVDDGEMAARFGLKEYFQLDLFVTTSRPIRFQLPDGAEHRDFGTSYPVSVCVPTLPVGIQEGENLRVRVAIPSLFFKLWGHPSDFMNRPQDGVKEKKRAPVLQWTPLFVGASPEILRDPVPSELERAWPGIAIMLFVIGLAGLAWYWEWDRRPPRKRV